MSTAAEILYGSTLAESAPVAAQPVQAEASETQAPAQESSPNEQPVNTGDAQQPSQAAPGITQKAIKEAVPETIRAAREVDMVRALYSPQVAFKDVIRDEPFTQVQGLDPEAGKALAAELREMAGDLGASAADVQMIASAMNGQQPTNEAQRIELREQCVHALNAEFGQQAKQAWLDARKFVAQDPRRAAILGPIGDDPRVVLRVAQLARAAKAAGKL